MILWDKVKSPTRINVSLTVINCSYPPTVFYNITLYADDTIMLQFCPDFVILF